MQRGFLFCVLLAFFVSGCVQQERCECLDGEVQYVISPGADDEIISYIRSSEKTVDVEMYLFNYRPLADELIEAANRGVKVRVILEPRLSGDNPNLEMMEYLRSNGIDARWGSLEYKLTHTKAMILDGKRVLLGSTNWSYSALKKNREYSILIDDKEIAEEFLKNFENDWDKASVN